MRYGVFSDAHANLEALLAVLESFGKEDVQGYIFCGDAVGYGPQPDECVEIIKKLPNITAVAGNHDIALKETAFLELFTPDSVPPVLLAAKELSAGNMDFINSLAPSRGGGNFCVVHGTFLDPAKEYWITKRQYKANYDLWKGPVCFVGHTHIPFVMSSKDNKIVDQNLFSEGEEITLDAASRYVINPGSTGQPRDGDNRACAGVYDEEKNTFKIIRAEYDIEKVRRKMAAKGFSDRLSQRLSLGV